MPTGSTRNNPLRRTSDRVQWWLGRVLLAIVIVGLPAASASVGILSYRSQLHTGQVQSATRHPVTAQLTADAAIPPAQNANKVPATAAWTASDGTTSTTTVRVWPGEKVGTPVQVWVNSHDAVASPPVTRGQATSAGWTAAVVTAASVSLLCLGVWKGSARVLDRHRYAQWDADWDQVEPRWSKRLPN
ncbi:MULTISPECIES: hypothetical protein [unclassified Kitasatospora]|uniref:Rv1733c family protein n=1 Tax=unclassified Kitasatospora TaxID=2633591 RepID=UPI0033FEA196